MLQSILNDVAWSYAILWTPRDGGLSFANGAFCGGVIEQGSPEFPRCFDRYMESCRMAPQQHGLASKSLLQRANLWHFSQCGTPMSDQMEERRFFEDSGIKTVVCIPWGSNVLELGNIEMIPQNPTMSDMILDAAQKALRIFQQQQHENEDANRIADSQRRHMLTERKRRQLEKEHLKTLKQLIPFSIKRDKVSILEGAVAYMRELKSRDEQQQHRQQQPQEQEQHPQELPQQRQHQQHPQQPQEQEQQQRERKLEHCSSKSDDSFSEANDDIILQTRICADDIQPALSSLEGAGYEVRSIRICPHNASMLELEGRRIRTFQAPEEQQAHSSS